MFDPIYEDAVKDKRQKSTSKRKLYEINKIDVINYNPLEELCYKSETPCSFYEILSIIQAFKIMSCSNIIDSTNCICLDLDDTDGFLMAIEGRFPYSLTYSLYTKEIVRIDNGLDLSRIDDISSSPHSVAVRCKLNNMNGIDLSFGVQSNSLDDSIDKMLACISVLSRYGTLVYRVDDYKSIFCRDIFTVISSWFADVTLYKPGMMSCINRGAYIVASSKRDDPVDVSLENVEESSLNSLINILEKERKICVNSIKAGIDNNKNFDINATLNYYLGK